jgi:hypothetical protein
MTFEIKDGETADVANAIDMDGEFSEKIDNLVTAIGKRKP